ncbi:twin-arginine translocation signal domain-containing protein [Maricaulis sp. MIT060901]|uniref:twin-arginine translocation signal domain-containing protein n=1 Tax=Maricaulis sp. MIT060901 TaxID=3096993 RepID=UPI00399BC813
MKLNRRDFLSRASAAGLLGTGGLTTSLMSMPALAADTTGYKALVCVFLFGGMDHYDAVIPYDQASHDSFATTRESLFSQYVSANSPRSRDNLLALNPVNAGSLGGRQFALPQELAPSTPCLNRVMQQSSRMLARCSSQPTGRWC